MVDSERELLNAISSFSKLIGGVQIKFYTSHFVSIFKNQGIVDTDFCRMIKSTPEGYKKCNECDKRAQNHSKVVRSAFIYTCHMGLTEMIHPAFVDNDFIGSFFFGQFHRTTSDVQHAFQTIIPCLKKWGISVEEARICYERMPRFSDEKINDLRQVLDLFAFYSVKSELVTLERNPYLDRIQNYIDEHLSENIMLHDIAEHLHLSPAYISNLFSKKKNITLFKYIQSRRINHACYLLRSSTDSIRTICLNSGFTDQNYFARIFKGIIGTTASNYREHYNVYESKDFFLRI